MASNESKTPSGTPSGNSGGGKAVPRPLDKGAASRSVDRAVKAGGGRTRKQTSTSWGYYGTLLGISVVGVGLIGQAWYTNREDPNPPYFGTEARATKEFRLVSEARKKYKDPKNAKLIAAEKRYADYVANTHIHAAYGIYDCTQEKGKEWLPPINGEEDADPKGIHAHADGLLHVHPFSKTVTGRRAVIGRWFDATGVKVTDSSIYLPAKPASVANTAVVARKEETLKPGAKCKDGKKSIIEVFEYKDVLKDGVTNADVKGQRALGPAKDLRIRSGYAYVFARVPEGFVPPTPPSIAALEAPSDVTSADASAVAAGTPTTAVGASTTVASGASSTVAGSASTTVKAAEASSATSTTVKP
jgi:hypothetical protein